MKRRILILLAATLFGAGFSSARPTPALADNAAVAVNTKDGTTVFKVAFAIRHVMSDVVTETNAAVAYNSCTDCASVAIAFEIVLVDNATVYQPQNVAIAINQNCTSCVAVAEAYQFVLGNTGMPTHFDAEGNRILADIRRRLHQLRKEDLTVEQLQALLNDMAAQIQDVLANHLVTAGPPPQAQNSQPDTTATTTAPTTTTVPTTTQPTSTDTTTTPGVTTTTGP